MNASRCSIVNTAQECNQRIWDFERAAALLRLYAITAATAVIALLAGLWYATTGGVEDALAKCRRGQVAGGTDTIGGPLSLVDHTGKAVTDRDIITGPTLLYFGYTFCPDVCPADTARNAIAVDILQESGMMVTPAMISIDPERDTPQVMADFVSNLHERMIGLTGTPEQIKAASRAYYTYYKKQDGDPDYYLMDHSVLTYLAFPGRGVVEYYGRDVSAEQMAESVACFAGALG